MNGSLSAAADGHPFCGGCNGFAPLPRTIPGRFRLTRFLQQEFLGFEELLQSPVFQKNIPRAPAKKPDAVFRAGKVHGKSSRLEPAGVGFIARRHGSFDVEQTKRSPAVVLMVSQMIEQVVNRTRFIDGRREKLKHVGATALLAGQDGSIAVSTTLPPPKGGG
jgi:hypothetical protein